MWGIERERAKKQWEREKERVKERKRGCVWLIELIWETEREIIWENKRERGGGKREREDVCEREILRKIERKRVRKRVRESKKIWFWISVIS